MGVTLRAVGAACRRAADARLLPCATTSTRPPRRASARTFPGQRRIDAVSSRRRDSNPRPSGYELVRAGCEGSNLALQSHISWPQLVPVALKLVPRLVLAAAMRRAPHRHSSGGGCGASAVGTEGRASVRRRARPAMTSATSLPRGRCRRRRAAPRRHPASDRERSRRRSPSACSHDAPSTPAESAAVYLPRP
jgi:hypothetical protein